MSDKHTDNLETIDPTNPEDWQKVANMTLLEVVEALAAYLQRRLNVVDLENTNRRNHPGDSGSDPKVEE